MCNLLNIPIYKVLVHYYGFLSINLITDAIAFSNAHFGAGTGSIFLDGLSCTGSESSLLDCSKSSSVYCSTGHNEDAGVRCHG